MADVAPELALLSARDRGLLLRDLVCAAVEELRRAGRSFDRVTRLITRLAVAAGLDDVRDREVLEQVVAWCGQRFYGA